MVKHTVVVSTECARRAQTSEVVNSNTLWLPRLDPVVDRGPGERPARSTEHHSGVGNTVRSVHCTTAQCESVQLHCDCHALGTVVFILDSPRAVTHMSLKR